MQMVFLTQQRGPGMWMVFSDSIAGGWDADGISDSNSGGLGCGWYF